MASANSTLIKYQYPDSVGATGNIISVIGAPDESSLINCSGSPSLIQANATTIALTGALTLPSIPNLVNTYVLLYNNSTKAVTYAQSPTTYGCSLLLSSSFTPSSTNIVLPDATTFTVGAYCFNTAGFSLTTGNFIPSLTANYNVGMEVLFTNAAASVATPDTVTAFVWDATNSVFVTSKVYVNTSAAAITYTAGALVRLVGGNSYQFRLAYSNGNAGSKTISTTNNGSRFWFQQITLQ